VKVKTEEPVGTNFDQKIQITHLFYLVQWKPLNVITLGQRDNINRMITISNCLLLQKGCLLVIWDLLNQIIYNKSVSYTWYFLNWK
jgi:hypothetical protein